MSGRQAVGVPHSRRPLAAQRRVRRLSHVGMPVSDDDSGSVTSEGSELTVVDTSEARLVWTRWRADMLDKLLLTAIREAKKGGQQRYLRATGSNVLFPEVRQCDGCMCSRGACRCGREADMRVTVPMRSMSITLTHHVHLVPARWRMGH